MPILEKKGKSNLSLQSTMTKNFENMTSISFRQLSLKELLQELLYCSEVYINENNVADSVNEHLNDIFIPGSGRIDKNQLFQMTLKGYLGLLNEQFYFRYTYIQKAHEVFGVNLNYQG